MRVGEGDVESSPWVGVGEAPAVSSSGGVLCQEDVAGFDGLLLAGTGLEFETAAERDHVLAVRGVGPVQAGAGGGLFESDGVGQIGAGYRAQGRGLVPFDLAHVEVRLAVVASEEANEPDRHPNFPAIRRTTGSAGPRISRSSLCPPGSRLPPGTMRCSRGRTRCRASRGLISARS